MAKAAVVLSLLLPTVLGSHKKFPPGFKFGAATSAYQIEGGWNASDKGESMWDRVIHQHPELIVDGTNGDVASDSYHLWRLDVQAAHNLGLHFYRFSISWSRLLPLGFSHKVSKAGARYYNNLINGLLERGIEPVITLYHWDLPQNLQDLGGWTNPLVTDWFAEYAKVAYSLYADRVKMWITINEPNLMCDFGYNTGLLAPMVMDPDTGTFLCNKHVIVAHAKAWRIYDEQYKPKYHGVMSLVFHVIWMEAASPEYEEEAELARHHTVSRYAHPIYSKEGGWPPSVEKAIAKYSKEKGYPTSRLPAFTKEEISLVRGTYDYFAVNYYTSRLVRRAKPGEKPGVFFDTGAAQLDLIFEKDPAWPVGGHHFVPIYPIGLRRQIAWIRQQYGDLSFFISENGYANLESDLNDRDRVEYFKVHLDQVLDSIHEDGANITGFTAWTLIDNFEWFSGYTLRFGLHDVDFDDPERPRTPRASAHFYADVIKRHSLDVPIKYHYHKRTRHPVNGVSKVIGDLSYMVMSLALVYKVI